MTQAVGPLGMVKGIGVAVAGGERARDAPHLEAELKVVFVGGDTVEVAEGHDGEAERQGDPEDMPRKGCQAAARSSR